MNGAEARAGDAAVWGAGGDGRSVESTADSSAFEAMWSTSKYRLYTYIYLHLPCSLGVMLAGIGLSHTTCGHPESSQSMGDNSALLVSSGLALATLSMGLIYCSVMHPLENWRLVLRFTSAVVLFSLRWLVSDLGCVHILIGVVAINIGQLAVSYNMQSSSAGFTTR